jgi:hypothetical protein
MSAARALLAVALLAPTCSALAQDAAVVLREGRDVDLVTSRCSMCHSLDYIVINSRFLDSKGWQAEVTKMIKVYAAPIPAEDADRIHAYLVRAYGGPEAVSPAEGTVQQPSR